MLSKAICQRCRASAAPTDEHHKHSWDWILHDDTRWNNGEVLCVATMNWEPTSALPAGCVFAVEQVVNEADSRGVQAVPQQ